MGQHTIIAIPHDNLHRIEHNAFFGKDLVKAILGRQNPNTPEVAHEANSVRLGAQFHSRDTFFVSVQDGTFTRLSSEEQICLENALRRLHKKKAKEQTAVHAA